MFKGFVPAVLASVATSIGGFLLFIPVTRNLIAKKFLPGEFGQSLCFRYPELGAGPGVFFFLKNDPRRNSRIDGLILR